MMNLPLLREKPLENIAGNEENAGHQWFLLFPQCFLILLNNYLHLINMRTANALNLNISKTLPLVKIKSWSFFCVCMCTLSLFAEKGKNNYTDVNEKVSKPELWS